MTSMNMSDVDRVDVRTESDVLAARQRGRKLADEMGFSQSQSTMIATAISELARNIFIYAGSGEVAIAKMLNGRRVGIRIIARDNGPGIADIEQALEDGFSTGGSLGVGLPGVRRLMDEFHIESVIGQGTTVTIGRWK